MSLAGLFKTNFTYLKARYGKYYPASFFLLGLLFDIFTTGRIDHQITLIQQAIFLFLLGMLLSFEVLIKFKALTLSKIGEKLWTYHLPLMHFFFGGLLSAFTIFYFKSASLLTSFTFMSFLFLVLAANESERFRNFGLITRSCLFSLCLVTYFNYFIPIVIGQIGLIPFLISLWTSLGGCGIVLYFLNKKIHQKKFLLHQVGIPFLVINIIFFSLHLLQAIPPVPISIQFMGIYHKVGKSHGSYLLYHQRPWWKFWHQGDQDFLARKGDPVYCFVRIFSPARFQDKTYMRWLYYDDKRGWKTWDVVPIPIIGGREEGYRGWSLKRNFQSGKWQVRVETKDQREIGRISFNIENDNSDGPREFKIESQ